MNRPTSARLPSAAALRYRATAFQRNIEGAMEPQSFAFDTLFRRLRAYSKAAVPTNDVILGSSFDNVKDQRESAFVFTGCLGRARGFRDITNSLR